MKVEMTNEKIIYPNKFNIGDVAICKKHVEFTDKSIHYVNQKIVVTEKNQAYFNVNWEDYELQVQ